MSLDTKIIAGVEFTAKRFKAPVPHWRPQHPNGMIEEVGVFKDDTRQNMWESMEHILKIVGKERFLAAFNR